MRTKTCSTHQIVITPIHVLAVTSLAYPFRSPSVFIVVVVISVIVIFFGHTCRGAQRNFTRVLLFTVVLS